MDLFGEITVSLPLLVFSVFIAFVVGYVGRYFAASKKRNHRLIQLLETNPLEASDGSAEDGINNEDLGSCEFDFEGQTVKSSRIVLVKFQLPVTITREKEGWKIRWDEILNATSALRFIKEKQVDYVGTCGYDIEDLTLDEREELEDALSEFNCYPLFLRKAAREKMYNVFCKGILWPLFHYFSPVDSESYGLEYPSLWQAFNGVSMMFAKKAALLSGKEPRVVIWFDDYHLMLCPSFLRKSNPQAKIGLFLHTPFPSSEMFRVLPTRVELVRGMLSADCIGFHTYDYARHFLSTCKRVLDIEYKTLKGGILALDYCGRQPTLRIGHLGICGDRVREICRSEKVQEYKKRLEAKYAGRKIILSVNGLSRGSVLKMQAIAQFLRTHPKWVQEVVFVEIIHKFLESAEDNHREQRRKQYFEKVKNISDTFGSDVVHVISACQNTMEYEELIAYYALTDVGLFANFWDGFARTPFELTVAQEGKAKPAQLILSEFMSCSRSLAGVIRIGPWNLNNVSDAIHTALVMTPIERKVAHGRRFDFVMRYSFQKWALGFCTDLEQASKINGDRKFLQLGWGSNRRMLFLPKDYISIRTKEHQLLERFRKAKKRLLLFDYGGTLTEEDASATSFCAKISMANDAEHELPKAVRRAFQILSADENTTVAVISGQKKEHLQEAFSDLENVVLSAEKGAFHRFPGKVGWEPCPDLTLDWKPVALDIMREVSDRTDGSWIDIKESALVWHFENADPEYGNMQAFELERQIKRVLDKSPITIQRYDNSRILEVLPKQLGKGLASQRLFKHFIEALQSDDLDENDVFLFCCGNDRSDEEMFRFVQNIGERWNPESTFTCSVGIKPTIAKYYLDDHAEVVGLLETISQYSSRRGPEFLSGPEKALRTLFQQNQQNNTIPQTSMGLAKSGSWSFGLNDQGHGDNQPRGLWSTSKRL